jgi:cell division protease FtsH
VIIASNFNENNFEMDEAMARRFKKKIDFRLPNVEERAGMLEFFLKKVKKKDNDIDTLKLAKSMSGLSGAIIETIIQEAGQIAIREKENVNQKNIMKAFETILIGKSDRKTTKNKEKERKIISIHEMGHFIVDFAIKYKENNNDLKATKEKMNLIKISSESISRANALGFVLSETNDNLLMSISEIEKEIKSLFGGVASEEIVFGKNNITTGAKNDIEKVTRLLNHLINETSSYSYSKISYSVFKEEKVNLEKVEEKSAELYKETLEIIRNNKDMIEYLSEILIDRWVLSKDEIFEEIEKYQRNK